MRPDLRAKLEKILQDIKDEYGICIHQVNIDWVNSSQLSIRDKQIGDIDIVGDLIR